MKTESPPANSLQPPRACLAFILLSLLILLSYWNCFDCSWHLDDFVNITWNDRLHIEELSPESLHDALFAYSTSSQEVSRPLPSLTFALNWYFGNDEVFGYHVVNLVFHLFTAFFLYLTVGILFWTPNAGQNDKEKIRFVALLTATLWALHPIHTQAVTYIVQRMAIMATLFYIMSLYFYLKARLASGGWARGACYLVAISCFLCALGSKENAALLPLSILLIEAAFFPDIYHLRRRKKVLYALGAGFAIFLAVIGFFFLEGILSLFSGYANRTFTPWERLLTEARVLVFYLSQIAYPISTRLSINHDFTVSTSLFNPWTTLPSILFILAVVGFSAWKIRRYPFVCLAVLFFFSNHLVESTILPLDLVFEHRNYLPSLFLFIPVAAFIFDLIRKYKSANPVMEKLIISFSILLIICLGTGTYIRNMAWKTEKSLWEDAMVKAPLSDRPAHNLAWGYYERIGDYSTAMALYQRALRLESNSVAAQASVYNNIAAIWLRTGNPERAVDYWERTLQVYPQYEGAYYRISIALGRMGRWRQAARYLDIAIPHVENSVLMFNLRALAHFRLGEKEKALVLLRQSLALDPKNKETLLRLGAVLAGTGHQKQALFFFDYAQSLYPEDKHILLWRIFVHDHLGETRRADQLAKRLIDLVGGVKIGEFLRDASTNTQFISPPSTSVASQIQGALRQRAASMEKLAGELPDAQGPQ